jgi:ferredoxin-NADP reductase
MAGAFSHIAFTENVKAQQQRMGSREAYGRTEHGEVDEAILGPNEIAFIEARDSFYQGTVSETGWPYVQHRGGPAGFLKVLDERTLGYADFSGNRQYISVGNLAGDDRISLFLMDYPQQIRLKLLGRVRIIDEESDPEMIAKLESRHYRARVERGIVIDIVGYDWNCPKYITPRFTEDEVASMLARAEHDSARNAKSAESAQVAAEEAIGDGELSLTVTGVRQMTPRIRAYALRTSDWGELPAAAAGAHLMVPVSMPDGAVATRQYSLTAHPERRDIYEIAVLREDNGRGGSKTIHDTWRIGTRLNVNKPLNHFPLHTDARHAVLIAGGIGITPIQSMAQALKARGSPFELHYTGRTPAEMAYRDHLASEFPSGYHAYFSRVPGQPRMNISAVLHDAPPDSIFYVCGPVALIDAMLEAANTLGIARDRVQYESFY